MIFDTGNEFPKTKEVFENLQFSYCSLKRCSKSDNLEVGEIIAFGNDKFSKNVHLESHTVYLFLGVSILRYTYVTMLQNMKDFEDNK